MSEEMAVAVSTKSPLALGQRGVQVQTLEELYRFARAACETDFMPREFRGSPEKAMVAMEFALELGLPLLAGLRSIAVINGRPAIYGDLMLGMVRASGLLERFVEDFEGTPGADDYRAVCISKRLGLEPRITYFSVADAKRAKLWGKSGPWTEYPSRMLQMRARSFNLRDNFSDILMGLGAAEEAMDIPMEPPAGGPQALTVDTTHVPAQVILPADVHPTVDQLKSLWELAASADTSKEQFARDVRAELGLDAAVAVTRKLMREAMQMEQFQHLWDGYTEQLRQRVEDPEDVTDFPDPNAPMSPPGDTISPDETQEASRDEDRSTGQGDGNFSTPQQMAALKELAQQVGEDAYADVQDLQERYPDGLTHEVYAVVKSRLEARHAADSLTRESPEVKALTRALEPYDAIARDWEHEVSGWATPVSRAYFAQRERNYLARLKRAQEKTVQER